MKRLVVKPFFFRLLRQVPMPVIAILVGVFAGLIVWAALDIIQSRQVNKIFNHELKAQLDLRSRESLIRFDHYMSNYGATTRLLANHRRLSQYLEPLFWFADEEVTPLVYTKFRPFWLPDYFERNELPAPSHVLLTDTKGRVREVYQAGNAVLPLPEEVSRQVDGHFRNVAEVRTVLTRFGDVPYLVIADAVDDSSGYHMGSLVVLVPVDAKFLLASQTGMVPQSALVALVDADEQRILISVDPALLLSGTLVEQWTDIYLVTTQSLPRYEGSVWNAMFATFVPQASVERMSRHVRAFEWRQRAISAVVFIIVYTLVIYLVSARLNKVLKRMSRFARRALGIEQPGFRRGANQLILLEDWIQHFTRLVLLAREEMSRRHETRMRETEALREAILEASLDSIVTLNQGGGVIEYNPTAERALGFRRQDAIGRNFADNFVARSDRDIFRTLLEQSRKEDYDGRVLFSSGDLTALRVDGSAISVEMSIVPIVLEQERFFVLYIHDITKRKEAEREIKSLARFAGESPNPILRVNTDCVIVYANAASRALLLAWGRFQDQRLPQEWWDDVSQALEAGEAREREGEYAGQIYALLFAPIKELGYVNIYVRDITAMRRAELELRQHQAELVHVCRLSTMGEVATGMAHELNQPLAAIGNYANGCIRRLKKGGSDPRELMDAMGQVATQAQRAGEIIRRLRALVGKQPPIRAETDLNHLVREVCSFVEFETAKLGLIIELDLSADEILVDVDLVQIEQVLLNLVRNAMDALQEAEPEHRSLRIRAYREENEARISVEDTGPGIDPERMLRLFDPFFTTKESGMGMGLPISQTILASHDGRIWAESEPNRRTVFHIALPLAGAESAGEPIVETN